MTRTTSGLKNIKVRPFVLKAIGKWVDEISSLQVHQHGAFMAPHPSDKWNSLILKSSLPHSTVGTFSTFLVSLPTLECAVRAIGN
jgi:hypothetical protein